MPPPGEGPRRRSLLRWRAPIRRAGAFALSLGLTFLGLILVTFVIARVVPIDPVLVVVGDRALPEVYERVKRELGLDLPLYAQFWRYLNAVLRGELGTSVESGRPVLHDLGRYFPATLELATAATLLRTGLGVPLGVLAATRHGR